MKKIRIYEIAKNLDVPAKTVIQELDKIGIKVKSHMSSVDVDLEDKLRDIFTPDKNKNKLKKGLNIENKKQNQNNKKKNIKKSPTSVDPLAIGESLPNFMYSLSKNLFK